MLERITLKQFMIEKRKYNAFFYATTIESKVISDINKKNMNAVWYQIIFDKVKIDKSSRWLEFSLNDTEAQLIIFSPILFIEKKIISDIEARYYIHVEDCDSVVEIVAVKMKNRNKTENDLDIIRAEIMASMNNSNIDYKNYILHSENLTDTKYLATLHNKESHNVILIECDITKDNGAVVVRKF